MGMQVSPNGDGIWEKQDMTMVHINMVSLSAGCVAKHISIKSELNIHLVLPLLLPLRCVLLRDALHDGRGFGVWGRFLGWRSIYLCWRCFVVTELQCRGDKGRDRLEHGKRRRRGGLGINQGGV